MLFRSVVQHVTCSRVVRNRISGLAKVDFANAAEAMTHAWNEEETVEFVHLCRVESEVERCIVVEVFGVVGRDQL